MLKSMLGALGAALVASILVNPSAAVAQLDTGGDSMRAGGYYRTDQECNWRRYRARDILTTATSQPVATHLSTYGQPPSGRRKVSKTTSLQTVLSAKASTSGGASVKVQNKILGEAEAHVEFALEAAGARTRGETIRVTDWVQNNTRHNVAYVFYRGQVKAWGRWQHRWCSPYYTDPGGHLVGYYVYVRSGKWRSYGRFGEGALRCGAGSRNLPRLERYVLRVGCA